jgi:hypothetical protein
MQLFIIMMYMFQHQPQLESKRKKPIYVTNIFDFASSNYFMLRTNSLVSNNVLTM